MAQNDLKDYLEPFETVQAKTASGSKSLAVYGLSLEEAVYLARDYGEHIAPVYSEIRKGGLSEERSAAIIADIITEAPALINMICYFGLRCSDEAEMDTVARFPVGLRIEIVEAVARMTFHSEAGGGKVLGIVTSAFRAAAGMGILSNKARKP